MHAQNVVLSVEENREAQSKAKLVDWLTYGHKGIRKIEKYDSRGIGDISRATRR